MPTYLQLAQEPVWGEQVTPANMTTYLLAPLRTKYGLGPAAIGAAGDNNHLYGRHRSRDWCLTSKYSTDRQYGTQDARDKRGSGSWYRGFDVGIKGQVLQDASRRVDQLTRSGKCPGIAEWFGTFNGTTVVGWYEGHASSSDNSHLWHLHVGVWTEFANDISTMQQLYAAITGEDEMTPEQERTLYNLDRMMSAWLTNAPMVKAVKNSTGTLSDYPNWLHVPIPTTGAELTPEQLDEIEAAAKAGAEAGAPTHEELVAAANEAEDS